MQRALPHLLPSVASAIAATLAFAACGSGPPADLPDVLLVSVDTLRADHLGCYGYPRATSPNIDQLAARGAVFERTMSTCPWTLPAHTSLLTGLFPAVHGVQEDGTRLGEEAPTLAEGLRRMGYRTLGVVSHVYVASSFGLGRGFETFDDSLIEGGTRNPIASEVVDRFLEHLDRLEPEDAFFGFLHFFDPHWDYTPPPPFDRRFTDPAYAGPVNGRYPAVLEASSGADLEHAIALYDGEIAYLDREIGRLLGGLAERGRLEDIVVVLTADHGEEFREHGQMGHGNTLYEEQLHVPLIIAGHPAFPAGTRRGDLASLVDVAPTLLEIAGAAPDEGTSGRSLLHPIELPGPPRVAESIQFGRDMRALRIGDAKLARYSNVSGFFRLDEDPLEQVLLEKDPTGGALEQAAQRYAAAVDSGWHVKLVARSGGPMRCEGTIRCAGRILEPRRYFSEMMRFAESSAEARFERFELAPDGRSFEFAVELDGTRGEIVFRTEPPESPVEFDLSVSNPTGTAGVFLGYETPAPSGPFELRPGDPRVAAFAEIFRDGCFLRAVAPHAGPASDLSEETRRHLDALGYGDG